MKRKIKDYFRYFLYIVFRFIFLVTPKVIMKKILQFLAFFAYKFNKKHKLFLNVFLNDCRSKNQFSLPTEVFNSD